MSAWESILVHADSCDLIISFSFSSDIKEVYSVLAALLKPLTPPVFIASFPATWDITENNLYTHTVVQPSSLINLEYLESQVIHLCGIHTLILPSVSP